MARNSLFGPFVLSADLFFFLGGEVILDVEGLADFLGGFTLDHVGDGLASDIEKGFDIEIVGGL